jgi:hypothetical protein
MRDTVRLDAAALEMLADIERQEVALAAARQSVLTYFAKQHKLDGQWQLAANRRELVRANGNEAGSRQHFDQQGQ